MAEEPKTKPTDQSPEDFLNQLVDEQKKTDAYEVMKMMEKISGHPPKMWGPSIIGFGSYDYKYDSGRTGTWMLTGFSPRKTALTLYLMSGYSAFENELSRLGKYKLGKSCLYLKKLSDVDKDVLEEMIKSSIEIVKKRY